MRRYRCRRLIQINVRLSREEDGRLEALAANYGLNASDVVRMLIAREHNRLASRISSARIKAAMVGASGLVDLRKAMAS